MKTLSKFSMWAVYYIIKKDKREHKFIMAYFTDKDLADALAESGSNRIVEQAQICVETK